MALWRGAPGQDGHGLAPARPAARPLFGSVALITPWSAACSDAAKCGPDAACLRPGKRVLPVQPMLTRPSGHAAKRSRFDTMAWRIPESGADERGRRYGSLRASNYGPALSRTAGWSTAAGRPGGRVRPTGPALSLPSLGGAYPSSWRRRTRGTHCAVAWRELPLGADRGGPPLDVLVLIAPRPGGSPTWLARRAPGDEGEGQVVQ